MASRMLMAMVLIVTAMVVVGVEEENCRFYQKNRKNVYVCAEERPGVCNLPTGVERHCGLIDPPPVKFPCDFDSECQLNWKCCNNICNTGPGCRPPILLKK
ncbi:uncharacterized protein LOC143018895 [Oratosquilla oratoria]|uniref:uncharacterized protein LOC143018895 n=1 Tax=Oratosquilla oratoria TaxID=337810 RepID=UPI003F76D312